MKGDYIPSHVSSPKAKNAKNEITTYCMHKAITDFPRYQLSRKDSNESNMHDYNAILNTPSRIEHLCADPKRLHACTAKCAYESSHRRIGNGRLAA